MVSPRTETKSAHDIASLIIMTAEVTKIIVLASECPTNPASNGVKRNYASRSFNISYEGVTRMYLRIVGIYISCKCIIIN